MTKEQSVLTKVIKTFLREKILLQHFVLNYRIDLYFPERKLAVEIDEKGREDRDEHKEIERQKAVEKELDCEFIRINIDEQKFDVDIHIGKIRNHIVESSKKLTKKSTKISLIDNVSKRLLELEFNSNHSIK